jgi:hypothetical protein
VYTDFSIQDIYIKLRKQKNRINLNILNTNCIGKNKVYVQDIPNREVDVYGEGYSSIQDISNRGLYMCGEVYTSIKDTANIGLGIY